MQEAEGGSPPAGPRAKRKAGRSPERPPERPPARPKKRYSRHAKPPYSYLAMIALVITASPAKKLKLAQVSGPEGPPPRLPGRASRGRPRPSSLSRRSGRRTGAAPLPRGSPGRPPAGLSSVGARRRRSFGPPPRGPLERAPGLGRGRRGRGGFPRRCSAFPGVALAPGASLGRWIPSRPPDGAGGLCVSFSLSFPKFIRRLPGPRKPGNNGRAGRLRACLRLSLRLSAENTDS